MPIWLASYPRSGNTLTRVLLHDCFGIYAGSVYRMESIGKIVGRGDPLPANGDVTITKTHGPPPDEEPAIYVVRHGIAAIVSYFHYLRDFRERRPSIEDLITGESERFGSWSNHFRKWDPQRRPRTLLLRFEEISVNPPNAIDRISEFIGRTPITRSPRSFDELRKVDPRFFRQGRNEKNISELSSEQRVLFNQFHGDLMSSLGYH